MQINNGSWKTVKPMRLSDGNRLKIRANIDNNISTFNANIDGTEVTVFLEVSKYDFKPFNSYQRYFIHDSHIVFNF